MSADSGICTEVPRVLEQHHQAHAENPGAVIDDPATRVAPCLRLDDHAATYGIV